MSVISDIDRDLHNCTLDAGISMTDLWILLNKLRPLKLKNVPRVTVTGWLWLFLALSDAFSSTVILIYRLKCLGFIV